MQNPPIISGILSDPFTQLRLLAVAKTKDNAKVKAIETITVKIATSFGATNTEKTVEREIKPISTPLEERLDRELKQHLGDIIVPVAPERLAKAKEIRQKLAELWSTSIHETNSSDDTYIEGLPNDGYSAVVNKDSGHSGVRISFKSK